MRKHRGEGTEILDSTSAMEARAQSKIRRVRTPVKSNAIRCQTQQISVGQRSRTNIVSCSGAKQVKNFGQYVGGE